MTALRRGARITGIGAAMLLLVVAAIAPRAAAAGWLVGFATVGAVVLGSTAFVLIHALTGGNWGAFARPALVAAAAVTPLLLLAFVVLSVGAPILYPWIAEPGRAGPGVAALYLNLPFFVVRGLVVLAGLAVLMRLDRRSGLTPLAAGIGLVWYAVGLDLVAVDWLQSLEPRYTSSAFGAQIIVDQLVAGCAWAILATPGDAPDARWNDLGSLLLATVLGEGYLILMTFIVHWYGDLPHQAAWYLRRSEHGWMWLECAGVLFGAAGPVAALLFASVRRSGQRLKIVAGAAMAGVLVENIWLVAPATTGWAGVTGPLAVVAIAGMMFGVNRTIGRGVAPTARIADGL